MKTAVAFGGAASGRPGEFERAVEFVCEAERLGVDFAWSAEAWGQDAVSPPALLAARTVRIPLGDRTRHSRHRAPPRPGWYRPGDHRLAC